MDHLTKNATFSELHCCKLYFNIGKSSISYLTAIKLSGNLYLEVDFSNCEYINNKPCWRGRCIEIDKKVY